MTPSRKFLASGMLGIVLGFAILALAGFVAVRAESDRRLAGAWLRHTIKVQSDLNRLYGLLQSAESGQRGFIITQDERYLTPCTEATRQLPSVLDTLAERVRDNPSQLNALAEIRPLLTERLEIVDQTISEIRAGRVDKAAELIRSGRGQALMDRLRVVINSMSDEEARLMTIREGELLAASNELKSAIAALATAIVTVGIFSIFNAQRQMNALEASRNSLKSAYNELLEETTRRETLEAQLRQAQRLEALGHLTGGIAHDFNNMLGVIVSSLNLLRRKIARSEGDYESLIDSAMDGAHRAANMVRRLLAFARQQPLSPTPLDANRFVSNISNMLQRALGENIALETVLAGGLWMTKVDQHELENAIVNLAVNARDAMPKGGKLTIETANCYLDDAYATENMEVKPGQYVMIAVTDTGQGMPAEIAAKAFDPFFTTKPVGKGTGLGLSQVHGFVKQTGGHIKIYSEPGSGACIKLYLPRYNAEGAKPVDMPPAPTKALDLPHGKPEEVVLVVEDDDTARRVTAQGVRELGYTVLEASGGPAAIDILRQRSDIVLMITDVVMPEMGGARLAREAVFRRHSLRVLFTTGYSRNAIVHNGLLDKDVSLLSKPFTLEQLAGKIRALIDRK